MVSTHLKNISQIGQFPQIGVKIKKYLKPPSRLFTHSYLGNSEGIMLFRFEEMAEHPAPSLALSVSNAPHIHISPVCRK